MDTVHSYNQSHCWQYEIRLKNLQDDLKQAGISEVEAQNLRVSDFEFKFVSKEDLATCLEIKKFIERHEWLGKMPARPTHRFIATYKGHLAGVIVMATPNCFSNILGKDKRHLEKLISRGACISWSPKNLGSALIMFSIRWMVKNTEFRFFTAYSDTEARELGTIYQACNFIYMGQNSGTRIEYFDPSNPKRKWFSDRIFRMQSQIKKYSRDLAIQWNPNWATREKINWDQIPIEIKEKIKAHTKQHQSRCSTRTPPRKHKYLYILGRTKFETNQLQKLFADKNPHLVSLPYPKHRVPPDDTAAKTKPKKEEILTKNETAFRPQVSESKFLTVKEAAMRLNVSIWNIYKLIGSDSSFPIHNIGVKKKWVVNEQDLINWVMARSKRREIERLNLPTGEDLLKMTEKEA